MIFLGNFPLQLPLILSGILESGCPSCVPFWAIWKYTTHLPFPPETLTYFDIKSSLLTIWNSSAQLKKTTITYMRVCASMCNLQNERSGHKLWISQGYIRCIIFTSTCTADCKIYRSYRSGCRSVVFSMDADACFFFFWIWNNKIPGIVFQRLAMELWGLKRGTICTSCRAVINFRMLTKCRSCGSDKICELFVDAR